MSTEAPDRTRSPATGRGDDSHAGAGPGLGWLPGAFHHPTLARPLLFWSGVGALIRLVLLPIGITTDALAVYWRAHVIAFHGDVYREYLVNMGSHVLHAVWLRIAQPLIGPAEQLWTHPWWWADSHGLSPEVFEAFMARPDALRVIFLLKLPYVLAEVGAGLLLVALVWGRKDATPRPPEVLARTRRLWIFWMLSPAAIYATLLFARYEAYPVLAVVLALFLAERDRPLSAAIVLGIAITLRTYPILFVPIFALVLNRGLVRQLAWSGVAVLPFVGSMALNRVVGGSFGEVAVVGDYSFGDNWFAFSLAPSSGPGVYVFVVAVLALGVYLLGRDRGWFGSAPVPRTHLWRWVALGHLAMFAFTQFSGHYLMWITPAIALLLGRTDLKGVVPLHVVQVAGVFTALFALWGGVLFTALLGGLGTTARTLLPPVSVLSGAGGQQLANIAWSAFVVATLALGLPLLVDTLRRDPGSGSTLRPLGGAAAPVA